MSHAISHAFSTTEIIRYHENIPVEVYLSKTLMSVHSALLKTVFTLLFMFFSCDGYYTFFRPFTPKIEMK